MRQELPRGGPQPGDDSSATAQHQDEPARREPLHTLPELRIASSSSRVRPAVRTRSGPITSFRTTLPGTCASTKHTDPQPDGDAAPVGPPGREDEGERPVARRRAARRLAASVTVAPGGATRSLDGRAETQRGARAAPLRRGRPRRSSA